MAEPDETTYTEDVLAQPIVDLIRGSDKADTTPKRVADKLVQNGITTVSLFVAATTQVTSPRMMAWALIPLITDDLGVAERTNADSVVTELVKLNQDMFEMAALTALALKVESEMAVAKRADEARAGASEGEDKETVASGKSHPSNNGADDETSQTYAKSAYQFFSTVLALYKVRFRYSPLPAEVSDPLVIFKAYRGFNRGTFENRHLEHWVPRTSNASRFTETSIGSDAAGSNALTLRLGTSAKAKLSNIGQVLSAIERRGLSITILGGVRIHPEGGARDVASVVRDGYVQVKLKGPDGRVEKDTENQHTTCTPWRRYSAHMHSLAASGASVSDLLAADAMFVDHVEERMAMYNENVGTAAMETLDWAPFATLICGVSSSAALVVPQGDARKGGGRGNVGGGLTEKKVKAWIRTSVGGGRGGGKQKGGREKPGRGLKKKPPKQTKEKGAGALKNICHGWNNGSCTETVCPNNRRHACVLCGKKGAKLGHTGCDPK